MLDKVKRSFNEGVKNVKWFAAFLSERTRAETSMAKILYQSSKMETRLDELYRDIGKRVLELKEKDEKAVLKDFIVLQTINETIKLREKIDDYKSRANELGKPS